MRFAQKRHVLTLVGWMSLAVFGVSLPANAQSPAVNAPEEAAPPGGKPDESVEAAPSGAPSEADADHSVPQTRQRASPTVSVGENGLHIQSADQRFDLGIRSMLQVWYDQVESGADDARASGFALGMWLPEVYGHYSDIVAFDFMMCVTPTQFDILNAIVAVTPHPRLTIRAGLQVPIFGLEWWKYQEGLLFFNRSIVPSLSAMRELGVAIDTHPVDGLRLQLGVYNGTDDAQIFSGISAGSISMNAGVEWNAIGSNEATDDSPGYLLFGAAVRLRRTRGDVSTTHLVQKTSLGGHRIYGFNPNVFADGRNFDTSVYAFGGYEGLYAQAQFVTTNTQLSGGTAPERYVQHAWSISAGYAFGGRNGWNGVSPAHRVIDGGLGALQLSARVQGLRARGRGSDVLRASTGGVQSAGMTAVTGAITWVWRQSIAFEADYTWSGFEEDGARVRALDEHVVRVGITVGY